MQATLRTSSAFALLWTVATVGYSADFSEVTLEDDAPDYAAILESAPPYFSEEGVNRHLTPERPFFDDPEVRLVQREEPVMGTTPEEQVLRDRVQESQADSFGDDYNYRQPYAYGPNSLLPGYYGAFGGYPIGVNTGKRWFFSVAQTADYVTNLALPLFVTPSNVVATLQDDYQFQTNAYAQYRIFGNQKHSLTTGFNYYQSLHPKVEQLDLFAFSSLTQYARVINDRLTAFANYTYSYYFLDNDSLLSRNGFGSGFTLRTRPRTYWTVASTLGDNYYFLDPSQTSTSYFIQLQRLQYIACSNWYWLASYAYGHNDARFNAWSYNVHSVSLGTGVNFGRCLKNNLTFVGNYGTYDFLGVNTPLGDTEAREDDIWSMTTRWSRALGPHSTIFAQWTYFNSNSNIARQNFVSDLYSIGGMLYW